MKEIWISPSDLSYMWNDSKLGFYDKYVLGIQRPRDAFPSMFTTIVSRMKKGFENKNLSEVLQGAPEGVLSYEEKFVTSKTIAIGEYQVGFKGKISCFLNHDDGSCTIFDFKTVKNDVKLSKTYFLHYMAYAFCLENPAVGQTRTVNELGIAAFDPDDFSLVNNKGQLSGSLNWVKIEKDKNKFKNWLTGDLKDLLISNREDVKTTSLDQDYENYINKFCEVE